MVKKMLLEVYSSIMQTSNKKLCFIFIKNLMRFQLTNAFFPYTPNVSQNRQLKWLTENRDTYHSFPNGDV